MANIHIARSQQQLGSFIEDEVREGIRTGRFTADDLAWREGMEGWKPLGEMAPQWGIEAARELKEVVSGTGNLKEDSGDELGPAWEHRKQIGLFTAVNHTIRAVLFRPLETFTKMKHTGGLSSPLLYAVGVNALLHTFFAMIPLLGILMMTSEKFQKLWSEFQEPFRQVQEQFPQLHLNLPSLTKTSYENLLLISILLWPLLEVIGYVVGAALMHLSLMLVGGARRPFESTFRTTCYLCGSFNAIAILMYLIPTGGVGVLILMIAFLAYLGWYSYSAVIAFQEAQGTETWRVIIAAIAASIIGFFLLMVAGVIMSPLVMAITGMTEKIPLH